VALKKAVYLGWIEFNKKPQIEIGDFSVYLRLEMIETT